MSGVEGAARTSVRWGVLISAAFALCAVPVATVAARTGSTTVTTHQTKRGKDLAAGNGRTLYLFSADKAGKSDCTGSCAGTWVPLQTTGHPVAAKGSGVEAQLLGTIRRSNHTLQVTYNGHPLYLFTGDTAAGQIGGEGSDQFGGHWYIVNPAGKAVKPRSGSGNLCNPICQGY